MNDDAEPELTMNTSIADKLSKANDRLVLLGKQRSSIEDRIEKNLNAIYKVKTKIDKIESVVERAAEEKCSSEMKAKLWGEISKLKSERQHTVKHLSEYRRKLKQKFKEYKQLSKRLE